MLIFFIAEKYALYVNTSVLDCIQQSLIQIIQIKGVEGTVFVCNQFLILRLWTFLVDILV